MLAPIAPARAVQLSAQKLPTLMVNVSVPWRLLSRDPGGLFGTIEASVNTCDTYTVARTRRARMWANLSTTSLRRWRSAVARTTRPDRPRPDGQRSTSTDAHARAGRVSRRRARRRRGHRRPDALLCERSLRDGEVLAADYPITIGELARRSRAGPPPGHLLVTSTPTSSRRPRRLPGVKRSSASGYTIDIVGPDGTHLSNDFVTSTTSST